MVVFSFTFRYLEDFPYGKQDQKLVVNDQKYVQKKYQKFAIKSNGSL